MTAFPKSIEAPITRFFHAPTRDNKGKKNGGMVAVLKFDESEWKGDVLVFEPDVDGAEWWSHVSRNAVIRASVREVAKNKEDTNGEVPSGDFSGVEAAKRCRDIMSQPVIQYNLDAELPDPSETNNPDFAGLFPGAKNYRV